MTLERRILLSAAPPASVFQTNLFDHYLVHIAMSRAARRTAMALTLVSHRFRIRELQDLHVREACSVHLASSSPLFTQEMQRLHTTDDFRFAELMQAAVIIFEAALLCSAQKAFCFKKCVQGLRHTRRTPDLRLLIDKRRVAYLVARRVEERGFALHANKGPSRP